MHKFTFAVDIIYIITLLYAVLNVVQKRKRFDTGEYLNITSS